MDLAAEAVTGVCSRISGEVLLERRKGLCALARTPCGEDDGQGAIIGARSSEIFIDETTADPQTQATGGKG